MHVVYLCGKINGKRDEAYTHRQKKWQENPVLQITEKAVQLFLHLGKMSNVTLTDSRIGGAVHPYINEDGSFGLALAISLQTYYETMKTMTIMTISGLTVAIVTEHLEKFEGAVIDLFEEHVDPAWGPGFQIYSSSNLDKIPQMLYSFS